MPAPPTQTTSIFPLREFAAAGGLMSYGESSTDVRHTLSLRGKSSANCNRVAGFAAGGSSLDQRVREGGRDAGRRARAAYHRRRSSNANGLRGQNSAGFPQIYATFQRHNLRRHF